MDHRLVVGQARSRRAEGVLHPGKSPRRTRGFELRPLPAADQDSTQGAQGRLAPVRPELLPPLPPGRASCRAGRYVNQPRRIPMCRSRKEELMSTDQRTEQRTTKTKPKDRPLNRRSVLLGSSTLAAAAAAGLGLRSQIAVTPAQAQPAPAPGRRPNILVIFGDDIGMWNISAYSRG